ncbi:MAG: hypothetical protein HKN26_05125 [Acidimicrobiales bacterium]|nr:hypothetical protein [Acidimicrobiales bacterium]
MTEPTAYAFLSPEWIEAARAIRDEYADQAGDAPLEVTINVIVANPPFADEPVLGHIDTSGGGLSIDSGHLDAAELTIEVPYDVARSLFVERDPAVAMQAFLEGKIKPTGDVSRLLAIQPPTDAGSTDLAKELAARLDAITA